MNGTRSICAWLMVSPLFCHGATPSTPRPATTQPTVNIEALPARPSLSLATFEKLARLKPLFDGRTLDGWIQAPPAPVRFAREDMADGPAFARRIATKSDAVSAWLNLQFDEPGRAALATLISAAPSTSEAKDAVASLLRVLNRIVAEPESLYQPERFRGVGLRAETTALQQRRPGGWELARLNRLLLEDAYPKDLVRSPSAAWVVKDGAMASTGAGRGVIYTREDFSHYRLVFQVRQISGNHVPGALIFGARPPVGELGLDALGAIQFQVPNGGHWDYRPGMNKAGDFFTRPVRIRFDLQRWAQVELLVNAGTGVARMAVAQPVGARGIEVLVFNDPNAARAGPIAWQMHNAGLLDEYRDVRIEVDPRENRLITIE